MPVFLMRTVPQSPRSCRNSITRASQPSALRNTEHHTAPGSLEGETSPGDLASSSDLLKGTRMDLWPYRGASPPPVSAQNQRQSLARAPRGGLLLLLGDEHLYQVHHLLLCTSQRGAAGLFGGLMLGRRDWGLPLRAPSVHPLVLYTMCTASPRPCWPRPHTRHR